MAKMQKPKTVAGSKIRKKRQEGRRKYERHFLKSVIARIDFSEPVPVFDGTLPPQVLQSAKKRFPVTEQQKQVQRTITMSPDGIKETTTEKFRHVYYDSRKEKNLQIGSHYAFVNYHTYHSFKDLQSDFLPVMSSLSDFSPGIRAKRIGLRYIDHIELQESNPTEWARYLSKHLLSSFNLADDQATISRAFHVLEFNYGDMKMRFQYGMPNPDHPAPINCTAPFCDTRSSLNS